MKIAVTWLATLLTGCIATTQPAVPARKNQAANHRDNPSAKPADGSTASAANGDGTAPGEGPTTTAQAPAVDAVVGSDPVHAADPESPGQLTGEVPPTHPTSMLPPAPRGMHWLRGQARLVAPACRGGAAIAPDDDLRPSESIWANVEIIVRRGKQNADIKPVKSVTTDRGGGFQVALERGTYCLVFAGKRHLPKRTPSPAGARVDDYSCLLSLAKQCDAIAEVPADVDVRIVHEQYCPWTRPCNRTSPPPAAPRFQ